MYVCMWMRKCANEHVCVSIRAYVPCVPYRYVCSRKMVESEKIIPILKVEG